jgi:serine O-acetyltransferase
VKEVPAGATVVGIPGRIVESKEAEAARFAAYAVVQDHSDPYAKAIQQLVEHSQELERALAALHARLAELEGEASRRDLRAVK